jgi:hypothetical protein
VSLFGRRDEPLHERLLREGGAGPVPERPFGDESAYAPAAPDGQPVASLDPLHGSARPREWDAVVTATAPDIRADALEFVVVEDGSLFMEDDVPEGSLDPLCDAVELKLRRPYRARAVRKDETLWAVSARRIQLVELDVSGDELELTVTRAGRELTVDGRDSYDPLPQLELRSGMPAEFHARATRVEGNRWELDVSPL